MMNPTACMTSTRGGPERSPLGSGPRLPAFGLLMFLLSGRLCTADAPDAIRAFVTIQPQAYFVEQVAGSRATVDVLVGPGQEPHTFEPSPRQLARLAEARVFFTIGLPFEARLLEKISAMHLPPRVVDTARGIPRRSAATDTHPDHEEADPNGADPHIWLAPPLVKQQAANICRGLEATDPSHAADYRLNLERFSAELDALDRRIREILAPVKGRTFYVFHPAFGYFADAYGLNQAAVQIGAKEPGGRSLAALVERMRNDRAGVIFVEPQFSSRSADAVARAARARVRTLDPLARDYPRNLERIARAIRDSFGERETDASDP
jgi:zinc transport system substrate-binding protein